MSNPINTSNSKIINDSNNDNSEAIANSFGLLGLHDGGMDDLNDQDLDAFSARFKYYNNCLSYFSSIKHFILFFTSCLFTFKIFFYPPFYCISHMSRPTHLLRSLAFSSPFF